MSKEWYFSPWLIYKIDVSNATQSFPKGIFLQGQEAWVMKSLSLKGTADPELQFHPDPIFVEKASLLFSCWILFQQFPDLFLALGSDRGYSTNWHALINNFETLTQLDNVSINFPYENICLYV